jgi:hypothetical protein
MTWMELCAIKIRETWLAKIGATPTLIQSVRLVPCAAAL